MTNQRLSILPYTTSTQLNTGMNSAVLPLALGLGFRANSVISIWIQAFLVWKPRLYPHISQSRWPNTVYRSKPAQFNFSEFLLWTESLLNQSVTVEVETLWDLGVIRRHSESLTIEPIQYEGQDRGFVAILGLVELNIKSRVSSSLKIYCCFLNEALTMKNPVPVKMFKGQSYYSRNTKILNSRGWIGHENFETPTTASRKSTRLRLVWIYISEMRPMRPMPLLIRSATGDRRFSNFVCICDRQELHPQMQWFDLQDSVLF